MKKNSWYPIEINMLWNGSISWASLFGSIPGQMNYGRIKQGLLYDIPQSLNIHIFLLGFSLDTIEKTLLEIIEKEDLPYKASNGHHIYLFENGNKYDGERKEGKFEGHGILEYTSVGDEYDGEWKDNKKHGYRKYFHYSRSRYEENYYANSKEGHGILYMVSGAKYDGEWKNNDLNGHGAYKFANGDKYDSEYKNGKRDGCGIMYYRSSGD